MIRLFIFAGLVTASLGTYRNPEPPTPQCGPNEVYSDKKQVCPPQSCESIYTTYLCANGEPEPGCNCINGYLRNADNVCIPSDQCEIPGGAPVPVDASPKPKPCPKACKGDPNATSKKCPNPCAPTCKNPVSSTPCTKMCLASGCECNDGYIIGPNGKCVLPENCPAGCNGDPNAIVKSCPNPCPQTCENPDSGPCYAACIKFGCECKAGYVLSDKGKCIPLKQCPVKTCNRDPNAEFRSCRGCDGTCANPNPICTAQCRPGGCQCKRGYVRHNGKCILPENCPATCKDPNEEFSECTSCEGSCDNPNPICTADCKPPGCQCKSGYVRSNGKCILQESCPATCRDPNEEFRDCTGCEGSCDNPSPICTAVCRPPGCQCKSGYVRSNGKCILKKNCPVKPGCRGDPNAILKKCPNPCPATCDNPKPTGPCPRLCVQTGCECKKGYVLSPDGKCILLKNCPEPPQTCGYNEVFSPNKRSCPPETCESLYQPPYPCAPPHAQPPTPGCVCLPGHLRDSNGICIPKEQCPPPSTDKPPQTCGYNEVFTPNKRTCPPETCETLYRPPYPCARPNPQNMKPGCECLPGHLRNSNGICIPKEQCPPPSTDKPTQTCGKNEVFTPKKRSCPPETCESLYQPPYPCPPPGAEELLPGCECLPGYLRDTNGVCIPKEQCPPPVTCAENEVYLESAISCPPDTCDTLYVAYSCAAPPEGEKPPPGCRCKNNYLRNSKGVCIPQDQCPPLQTVVGCGGDGNASWSDCTSACPPTCDNPNPICTQSCQQPGCQCNPGYLLFNNKCILPENCPAPKCPIPPRCRQTCAVPNPSKCPVVKPATTNVDGCQCKEGYVLEKEGGPCIKIEDCPPQNSCNGDPNAVVVPCPWACQPTCKNPEAALCKAMCMPVGCNCKPGYIRSKENGKCILPDTCPGGNPCGKNGKFLECGFRCPNQYCPEDDSGVKYACKPGRPCPPGCGCKDNYKRLSLKDETCVLASDCPIIQCTRPNEVWSKCPSDCLAESCDNVNDPQPVCDTPLCEPKCVCQQGYYRNTAGECVPAQDCPGYNPCASSCTPTCANPNPPNCDPYLASTCCESGYVLSEKGGKCIKIEDCPRNGCNGDPNAIVKQCPAPCPSTCDSPNAFPCRKACKNIGCECAPGYLFNKEEKCVLPEQCPGGNPCRNNERFVTCKVPCPTDYCPTSDTRAVVACDPPFPCLSGCVCNLNYRRKSVDDDRCIVASDCPPVKCTRPNEVWSPCPSDCSSEYCDAVDQPPVVCNFLLLNCQPRCVCKKNYYRNTTDICISAHECRQSTNPPNSDCEE